MFIRSANRVYASAKSTESRPVFNEALAALFKADEIAFTKLDRVTRSTRDVLTLVEDVLKPQGKALFLISKTLPTR